MELQKIQHRKAKYITEEPHRKREEVAHALIIEGDVAYTQEGAKLAASHCQEMDEQIRLIDWNLKCPSAAEEKYFHKEDKYEEEAKMLPGEVKEAETSAEYAVRLVDKLETTIDDLEDKLKCISEDQLCTQSTLERTLLHQNEMHRSLAG
ncbi:Tropomyosin alpha-3 chain [Heterocephalus glaber]|uniref:Tropomyosin alpha-3 chain n=1 Tax=Heterocephalus glaber TaxID=10181 RepID=G5AYA3_HETGA|nr:Tropomyosin alpha-3 chain [Heterocephalus glaber]